MNLDSKELPNILGKQVSTAEEVIEVLEKEYASEEIEINSMNCQIDDNLNISLFNNQIIPTSYEGLRQFSRTLGIPWNYGENIPVDLLTKNINRLTKERNQNMILYVSKEQKYLVDAAKSRPRDTTNFQSLLSLLDKNNFEIDKSIYVSENQLQFSALTEKIGFAEPKVGDITKFGLDFNQNWLMNQVPYVRCYSKTLVCSNGATYSKNLKFGAKTLQEDIKNYLRVSGNLVKKLNNSAGIILNLKQFNDICSGVKRRGGEEFLNKSLEVPIDLYKKNKNLQKEIERISKTLSKPDVLKEEDLLGMTSYSESIEYPTTEKNLYDIFAGITRESQKVKSNEAKDKLNNFAGGLISTFCLN